MSWLDPIKKKLGMHVHDWSPYKYETESKNMLGWIDHGGSRYERKYTQHRDNKIRTCKTCNLVVTELVQYRETERD